MAPFSSFFKTSRYAPLNTLDDGSKEETDSDPPLYHKANHWSNLQTFLLLLWTTLSMAMGLAMGYYAYSPSDSGPLVPSGNIDYPMVYNRTFTEAPSAESNAAWDSMFPKNVGFVKHPSIAPRISGLAVFHELHCVNILRVGYYAALDGTIADMQHVHDHNKRPDPHHLRHCFDYLRQSLMCAADTNLEPVVVELGGVTGWSFQRTCRNFDAVKEWAEEWGSWDENLNAEASP